MRKFLKTLLNRLILLLDSAVKLRQHSKIHHCGIAIIRLDAIGDFTIWLDSAKEYRRIYPSQKIVLIVNAACFELARHQPFWDEVWPVNLHRLTSNYRYRWTFLRRVNQAHFTIAIQPAFSRDLLQGDSVLRATGAPQRIGSQGDTSNTHPAEKAISDRWYTKLLYAKPGPLMELLRNAEFISQLTGIPYVANLPKLSNLPVLPTQLRPTSGYCILFPGASWHGKQWGESSFVEIGMELNRLYGWQIVLCGAPNENTLCQEIANSAQSSFLNLAGKTNLAELAELIRVAQLLVTNDTSAVHIAAAVGTPAVCITGGGHHGRFIPYPDHLAGIKPVLACFPMPCFDCNWECNQPHDPAGPVPCIRNVSVALVWSKVELALSETATVTRKQAIAE